MVCSQNCVSSLICYDIFKLAQRGVYSKHVGLFTSVLTSFNYL